MIRMKAEMESSEITIGVFTGHAADSEHKDDPQYEKCTCRKHLYI